MQWIDALLDRHAGEPAWVFGKGPSLDDFAMDEAGPLRLCVNESLLCVPQPRYFFAHDELPVQRAAATWPSGCAAILQEVRGELALRCGVPEQAVYAYDKRPGETGVLELAAAELAERRCLFGNSGTLHSALHFCCLIGVSEITLVGCDGGGGYAECLQLPPGGAQHERIRRDAVDLMERLGMPYRFWDPAEGT